MQGYSLNDWGHMAQDLVIQKMGWERNDIKDWDERGVDAIGPRGTLLDIKSTNKMRQTFSFEVLSKTNYAPQVGWLYRDDSLTEAYVLATFDKYGVEEVIEVDKYELRQELDRLIDPVVLFERLGNAYRHGADRIVINEDISVTISYQLDTEPANFVITKAWLSRLESTVRYTF